MLFKDLLAVHDFHLKATSRPALNLALPFLIKLPSYASHIEILELPMLWSLRNPIAEGIHISLPHAPLKCNHLKQFT